MSRQPYFDEDSFRLQRGQDASYGGQNFVGKSLNTFEYGHSNYDAPPVQFQSYDRGNFVNNEISPFGTSYERRNVGELGGTQYLNNGRRDTERFDWGGSDCEPLRFEPQLSNMSNVFHESRMSHGISGFQEQFDAPRMVPEWESSRNFQISGSPSFRRQDELKRSFDDSGPRTREYSQWSSSKPKYQRIEHGRSGPVEQFIRRASPPKKHYIASKHQSQRSTVSSLHKKVTNQKSSVPASPSVPRKPMEKINKNTVNVQKDLPKSNSTPKTAAGQCNAKFNENIDVCPWLDAEQITEEELTEKFPSETFEMTEETCLKEKGDMNMKENLPPDWTATYHVTGFPVYLHKPTAVVTLSKPYQLGNLNLRTHMFPVASIPCLQYARELDQTTSSANQKSRRRPPIQGDKKSMSKPIPEDKGTELEPSDSKCKDNLAEKGDDTTEIAKPDMKDIKSTDIVSQADKPTNAIPSNLDKKTKDAVLQFQEELQSKMKGTSGIMDEEEEYEKEMMCAFLKYQEDVEQEPVCAEDAENESDEVIEAVDHDEFLKYCERLFEFETVKLAARTNGNTKHPKKTFYCLGRKKRQVNTEDKDVTTLQLRRSEGGRTIIKLQWKKKGIYCPVSGCKDHLYKEKNKFLTHWQEIHIPFTMSTSCPKCSMSFKRRSDLKGHITRRHETNQQLIMKLMLEGKREMKKNKWYVYPGHFRFYNTTQKKPEDAVILEESEKSEKSEKCVDVEKLKTEPASPSSKP